MVINGVDFEWILTKLIRYDEKNNRLVLRLEGKIRGEDCKRLFDLEIKNVDQIFQESFERGRLIDE